MSALRALAKLRTRRRAVERVTSDAVKGGLAPLELETLMIAPVVPQPQAQKHCGNEHAVDQHRGGEREHLATVAQVSPAAKRRERAEVHGKRPALGVAHNIDLWNEIRSTHSAPTLGR